MAFSWSKLQFHHVTDTFLTIIEENPRYRQAFGFSKEPDTVVTTGGQTTTDLYTEVAKSLLVEVDGFDFDENDLPELQKVISNRVAK
jgi:hypothetical protein